MYKKLSASEGLCSRPLTPTRSSAPGPSAPDPRLVIAGYYPLNRPPRTIIASVIIILECITLREHYSIFGPETGPQWLQTLFLLLLLLGLLSAFQNAKTFPFYNRSSLNFTHTLGVGFGEEVFPSPLNFYIKMVSFGAFWVAIIYRLAACFT